MKLILIFAVSAAGFGGSFSAAIADPRPPHDLDVTCERVTDQNIGTDKDLWDTSGARKIPAIQTPFAQVFATKTFKLDEPGCNGAVVCESTFLCTHPVAGGEAAKNRVIRNGMEGKYGFKKNAIQRKQVMESDANLDENSPGPDEVTVYEQVACPQVNGACPSPTDCYHTGLDLDYSATDGTAVRGNRSNGAGAIK